MEVPFYSYLAILKSVGSRYMRPLGFLKSEVLPYYFKGITILIGGGGMEIGSRNKEKAEIS